MTFLAPLALWGLLALSVPLLLHLRRRRVGRTIQVGSLKHLETLPTAERRGPRVRDPLRLLLRATILALVVLLLAGPRVNGEREVARGVVLVDSSASPALRDSLAKSGDLVVADLASPWEAIARVDDSLPAGIPLIIVATSSSDRYNGPRPLVHRSVRWIDAGPSAADPSRPTATVGQNSAEEQRALDAAVSASIELLGTPHDTIGWEGRLPPWWRDSLDSAAFPDAVARALIPARALPAPVMLSAGQLSPRAVRGEEGGARSVDLHWWGWALAVLLFLVERIWARRLEGAL